MSALVRGVEVAGSILVALIETNSVGCGIVFPCFGNFSDQQSKATLLWEGKVVTCPDDKTDFRTSGTIS